jgi:hypothetical protein
LQHEFPAKESGAGRSGAERNLAKLTREIDRALVSAANATLTEDGAKNNPCFLRISSRLLGQGEASGHYRDVLQVVVRAVRKFKEAAMTIVMQRIEFTATMT